MLQSRNLDDQRFEDIVEHAVGRIPQLCPQWTNHNPSDPGITLIELLAWYKEMQQYHMNACTDDIRRKLLQLAGGEMRPEAAAHCGIELRCEKPAPRYPALSRLETPEGIIFELLEDLVPQNAVYAGSWVQSREGVTNVTSMLDRRYAGVQPFSFGGSTKTDFLISFSAIPADKLRIWFEVRQPQLTARNPFVDVHQTPRTIRWFWEGVGPAEILSDETHAFSQDGYITFMVPKDLPKTILQETTGAFWHLRAKLEDPGCEESVCLSTVEAGRYEAAQQETWSMIHERIIEPAKECSVLFDDALSTVAAFTVFLRTNEGWEQITAQESEHLAGHRGVLVDGSRSISDGESNLRVVCSDPIHYADLFYHSTGLPDQTIRLDLRGMQALTKKFYLICDTLQVDGSVRPEIWHCVEDLYASGPRDRVFVYDPVLEQIRFGNGRSGAIVPRGEHAIFLAGLTLSACAAGNIPEGERLRFLDDDCLVWNSAAVGGVDRETTAEAAARFLRRLEHPHKCTAALDYEYQALATPGLRVASARALPGYDPYEPTGSSRHPIVTVVVIPAAQTDRPLPDERFLNAVRMHLERHRPIGTVVRVIAPRYIGVTVSAQLRTVGPVDEASLKQAVNDYLTVGQNSRNIGDMVALHAVSTALQRTQGVLAVERIQLQVDSAGCTQTAAGDVLLPKNAVAYLKNCRFIIR